MRKEYLLTPGPTAIPSRVLSAMAVSTMHHRTDTFKEHLKKAFEGLQWLFDSDTQPLLLACSGTGGLEAVLSNTLAPGDKVIIINAGVFGERWATIATRLGLRVVENTAAWGMTPTLKSMEEIARANKDAKAFLVQHSETSTTVLHPIDQILPIIRKEIPSALLMVDAISSLATTPISMRSHNIDVLVAASQKALMLPPGLTMIGLSARAWETCEKASRRSFYFDFITERESQTKGTTAWTPAITLILGLNESLQLLKEEGLAQVYKRHSLLAEATRSALAELGFAMLAPNNPASGVTGVFPPRNLDADALRVGMWKNSGVRIAGGQGKLKGKILRFGHMGYVNRFDILTAISALEIELQRAKHLEQAGNGVTRALKTFLEAE